jgi:4-oxalocrotonate tautomerase
MRTAERPEATTPFTAITEALQLYFDGLYHSDTDRLGRVFHPNARYVTASGDELVDLGMAEYLPIVDKRPAPAASNQPRRDRIVSIAMAGPKTAAVTVNCAIADRYFTDFLTLIHVDGDWRIISKVFHYDLVG